MKTQKWYTQDVLFHTRLFGKVYFWMRDVDGTIYLAKSKEQISGTSVDEDGNETIISGGLVPDLT